MARGGGVGWHGSVVRFGRYLFRSSPGPESEGVGHRHSSYELPHVTRANRVGTSTWVPRERSGKFAKPYEILMLLHAEKQKNLCRPSIQKKKKIPKVLKISLLPGEYSVQ